jgi:hypothetical protein
MRREKSFNIVAGERLSRQRHRASRDGGLCRKAAEIFLGIAGPEGNSTT